MTTVLGRARRWAQARTFLERLIILLFAAVLLLSLAVRSALVSISDVQANQQHQIERAVCVTNINAEYQAAFGGLISHSIANPTAEGTTPALAARHDRKLARLLRVNALCSPQEDR